MVHVLYLTCNGLLEPLGQSQILPYLIGLSSRYKITVVTFEKPWDLLNTIYLSETKSKCLQHRITWIPLRFRLGPSLIAPLLSGIHLFTLALALSLFARPQLIHARSYIPAVIALSIKALLKIPFLFDMRALWPAELVASGRIRSNSLSHKYLLKAEEFCISYSSATISLTHAAVGYLSERYHPLPDSPKFTVIPTCVDLQRFSYSDSIPVTPIVIGCIGTVISGWFQTHWLQSFLLSCHRVLPSSSFEVVTRDDKDLVLSALDPTNQLGPRLRIYPADPIDMPSIITSHSASVMFFTPGLSKLGSSPTRLGEVLASGRPVVTGPGVGDVDQIIATNNVGVIINDHSQTSMDRAVLSLIELLNDTALPHRCRKTAQEYFSLKQGTLDYLRVYNQVLS